METILITGGSGFVGSSVVRLALERGFNVVNIDALTYAASTATLADVETSPTYTFQMVDLRERTAVDDVFDRYRPNYVLHLAAESHVDRSINDPKVFIDTNVVGTFNLLEAARRYFENSKNDKRFLFHHVSTDEVYGSLNLRENRRFTEETAYDPSSPYSASKACSDHLVRAWHETYGLPVVITNCSNNYGPYQHPEKLIPRVIINAINGKKLPIYGDGQNIRDWLYVGDHASALLKVMKFGQIGRTYNVGSENEYSNLAVVESICDILDEFYPRYGLRRRELITFVADRPGHDRRYGIDPRRLRSELNWQPDYPFTVGLKKTVKWYIDNSHWWQPLTSNHLIE